MNRLFKQSLKVTALSISIFLILMVTAYASGIRVNTTKSIPIGFYHITDDEIHKGAYVIFCPPQLTVFDVAKERDYIGAGFCPGGYGYMMKRILAAKNDMVSVTKNGVKVNNELLAFSIPIEKDKAGRLLPRYQTNHYTLGESELLLMSDVSGTSFDGRYFGPINRTQIEAVIRPIIIW